MIQVGIVGAGPAGLLLSHLLHQAGIESIIIEKRSRAYCESRVRAGVIEHWARELLISKGIGERMQKEGLVHDGIKLCYGNGLLRAINFKELVGRGITVYGQQELVKDLINRRISDGGKIYFGAENTTIHAVDTPNPKVLFTHEGRSHEIRCDFVGGCDGFKGMSRTTIPEGVLTTYTTEYPFGWLGVLSESPPPDEELIYCHHQRGFALFTMRSPNLARLYVQCDRDDIIENWPEERIWKELKLRLGGVRSLAQGKIVQKNIAVMRSFVVEPMQYGRLFLAGDSAHVVPATGAKGMNLAMADVVILAQAITHFYKHGSKELLDQYSQKCLRRIWNAQRFSWYMTQALHKFAEQNEFDSKRQLAELDYISSSHAAAVSLAENYTGIPLVL